MLKKFSKFLLLVLVIFVVSTSFLTCLADENHDHDHTTTATTNETNQTPSTELETHNGNLYLFGNNIIMDKYVDGNVFIFGNTVNVTGQVNGNLYVFANNLSFQQSIIRYSIFACADSIYYNGGTYEGDFYVAAKKLEMTYDSFVSGSLKAVCSDIILKSAIGENVDLLCTTLNLGEEPYTPAIYGNFNYSTNTEITIPEDLVQGLVNYTSSAITVLTFILFIFSTCAVTSIGIYTIIKKYTILDLCEKYFNTKLSAIKLLKALGVGLVFILVTSILFTLLFITKIGILLALILAALFIVIALTSIPALTICITNSLKNVLKTETVYMYYLTLTSVNVILVAIAILPSFFGVLGIIISIVIVLIIFITSIGLVITPLIPHKNLSQEEKAEITEQKKQAKAKRKQEKLEAKSAKKEEKTKVKEVKKNNKEN